MGMGGEGQRGQIASHKSTHEARRGTAGNDEKLRVTLDPDHLGRKASPVLPE